MADNHFKVNRGLSLAPQSSAPSNPSNGDVYYDSGLNKFQKYENGAWSDFGSGGGGGVNAVSNSYGPVASTAGQTSISLGFAVTTTSCFFLMVDGKMLSLGSTADYTFTNSSTIALNQALPAGLNIQAFYFGTVTSGTVVTTASPLTKNYLTYSNFENNATTGWSLFNTTLTNKIPTGSISAGASSLALSASASSPLAGTYSMQIAAGTAATAGHGVISDAFTINSADQAKVMGFSFNYKAVSGTMDFSGTSSNTFAVYIYDVTNSQWIQPAGVYNLVQGSGVGVCSGTFQTSSNGTQYRIAVICINSTGGAVTLAMDEFFLGPPARNMGPAMSDWTAYTPTLVGFGTVSNLVAYWRRVGDSIEVQGSFISGTSTAAAAQFGLPSGIIPDTAKLDSNPRNECGEWSAMFSAATNLAGSNNYGPLHVDPANSTTSVYFAAASSSNRFAYSNGNTLVSSGNGIAVKFKIPVAGWSSNSVMSNDTETRAVAACAYMSANVTANSNTPINFDTVVFDTHGAITTGAGTWNYKAPVSGIYRVSGYMANNGPLANNISIYKNGSVAQYYIRQGATSEAMGTGSVLIKLNAGDTIDVRGGVNATYVGDPVNNTQQTYICIERVSGPAVITAADTVACEYVSTAGNNVANSTVTFIDFATKETDSGGSVLGAGSGNVTTSGNGWRFIAPVSGRYQVNAQVTFSYTGGPGTQDHYTSIYVNGVEKQRNETYVSTPSGTIPLCQPISGIVKLNAGDRVEIVYWQSGNGTRPLVTTAGANRVSICRLGN